MHKDQPMTPPEKVFEQLVGKFIHNCGALELCINNQINVLATDTLLARDVAQQALKRRIRLLVALLKDRKQTPQSVADELREKLLTLVDRRNKVAHSPIVAKKNINSRELCLLVLDRKNNSPKHRDIKQGELESWVKESSDLRKAFTKLFPESIKI